LLVFKIGEEEFGIDILKVQEINRMMQITKVPNSPEFIDGVVNLRGRIIPVIDLRTRLNMSRIEHDNRTRIIVVDLSGVTVGFIVDEVSEVLRIPKSITEPPPAMVCRNRFRLYYRCW
jgi:purine-binding chemotaxis protein CheW